MTTQATQIENLKRIQAEEINNGFLNGELYNLCQDSIYQIETFGRVGSDKTETLEAYVYGGRTMDQINKNRGI